MAISGVLVSVKNPNQFEFHDGDVTVFTLYCEPASLRIECARQSKFIADSRNVFLKVVSMGFDLF